MKTNFINELCKVTNASYFSIQEHFRKSKTIEKFFNDEFPDFNSYIIPGHRNSGQDLGRPKAGLAQLSSKNTKIKKTRVKTNSYRIQAQILYIPISKNVRFGENGGQGGIPHHGTQASSTSKVLWINSYLPTDPGTVSYDDTELDEVLSEIESILTSEIFDDLIWGGDLNWHKGRNTGFAESMERFLNKHDLVTVWDHFTCSHTHIHTDFKSTSLIDHFIVNKRLLQHIDCAPIHLGDNLSRLSPIILKLNVENLPCKSSTNESQPRKPSWQKQELITA